MAYVAPIVGAAAFVYGAVNHVGKVVAESHPLVKAERWCWARGHTLEVDPAKEAALLALVAEHFQLGSKIELCYMRLNAAASMITLEYEHW